MNSYHFIYTASNAEMGSWLVWVLLDVLIKFSVSSLRKIRFHYRPILPKYTMEQLSGLNHTKLHPDAWTFFGFDFEQGQIRSHNGENIKKALEWYWRWRVRSNPNEESKSCLWSYSFWKDWLSAPFNIPIFFSYSVSILQKYLKLRHRSLLLFLKQRNLNHFAKVF